MESSKDQVRDCDLRLLTHPNTKGFKMIEYSADEAVTAQCYFDNCTSRKSLTK